MRLVNAVKRYGKLLNWRVKYRLPIMDSKKTLKYIKDNNCSVARFGDGEFGLIDGVPIGFQKCDNGLKDKLLEVLKIHDSRLLVCVPNYLNTLRHCTKECRKYWINWGIENNRQQKVVNMIRSCVKPSTVFGDALITRPYIDTLNTKRSQLSFEMLKSLWHNKDVLIVEGEHTCLGVGNDLLSNASSIKRIIAPAKGAFDCYDRILDSINRHYQGELILIALGPTATVLAADLALLDMQALDVGHMDVEYEWFNRGCVQKEAIPKKNVNEVKDGQCQTMCDDLDYCNSIVDTIKAK